MDSNAGFTEEVIALRGLDGEIQFSPSNLALSRRNYLDRMASADTDSAGARFAIVLSALRLHSNCRCTPLSTMRSRVMLHQWDCRGQAVSKLSGGDAAMIAIGVCTCCVPETKILGIGMLLLGKVCYIGIVLKK